ncbi:MAG: glycerol-3-phosphate acyltransferase [Cyanobacteria bacterium P01_H01_bin.121]
MNITLAQVGGVALIFMLCPLLGALPLIDFIVRAAVGQRLARIGTGNISVSAAFYHGGTGVGLLAVASEALKGIAAVLLARAFFPAGSAWELLALIALVIGRYSGGRGAGTTNVVWGYLVHDWTVSVLTLLIGGGSFTIMRQRRAGRLFVLVLLPLLTLALHPHAGDVIVMSALLSLLLAWIYQQVPDDLDLPVDTAHTQSRSMFQFFRGDRALVSLDQRLDAKQVGAKAATLAQLKYWGYAVPPGWVLCPGDDPEPLLTYIPVSPETPYIVRSSAVGEDGATSSAAGQYLSILDVTSREQLATAVRRCLASYGGVAASQYRRDRGLADAAMAVLVQQQIAGAFSGVAFSRDPVAQQGNQVVIEALPGLATQVVSGQVTPERYQVHVQPADLPLTETFSATTGAPAIPDDVVLTTDGSGDVPRWLLEQVAYLARQLEARYYGIPQDLEWSYDGQTLWVLQCRPITTLTPIWTRKIAAEVIPGVIRPLTWSINRPLTCGVWGQLFTVVLGQRARQLDFGETATLHFGHAYFNATLLGEIFRRMGLPADSLEFLTRGAKFSKPPLISTLRNVPGLWRLLQREWRLDQDFRRDQARLFQPLLEALSTQPLAACSELELLARVDQILAVLEAATYYSILSPLSLALRAAILQIPTEQLDNTKTPEVMATQTLQTLANAARKLLPDLDLLKSGTTEAKTAALFAHLAETPGAQPILQQLDDFLATYGYLSEVGTDIAVPTWQEDPTLVRSLFTQMLSATQHETPLSQATEAESLTTGRSIKAKSWQFRQVQQRLDLKGQVTDVYSRLLAHLRWTIVALGDRWQQQDYLETTDAIFFLTLPEIREQVKRPSPETVHKLKPRIQQRQAQFAAQQELRVAPLVYGNNPPDPADPVESVSQGKQLLGLGASPGVIEGVIQVMTQLQADCVVEADTILVVPYTDSAWAPFLAQAGGLIAEVGGQLSHGAIVAREYGIPAVMDIPQATQIFKSGQRVRLNGHRGSIEILEV